MSTYIFDPTALDSGSTFRGGGRFIQLLKENLSDVTFVSNTIRVKQEDTLLVPFFSLFQPPFLTKKIAKKQIISIYDVIPLKYPSHFPVGIKGKINLWRNMFSLKHYDEIVTISEVSKKDIHTYLHVPLKKITIIYLTLSKTLENKSGQKPKIDLPEKYLLYVGDVNWNKNIVNLAKAAKIANIPVVFVGKAFSEVTQDANMFNHPWQKEFQTFIEEVKNNPLFIFPGYISNEELLYLYQHAYLNVLLSRDEGYGFSYLEASKQKTPSLLSNTPVFKETAEHTAFFIPPEDPEKIAEIITAIQMKEREQMGQNAYNRSTFFSREKFANEWKKILEIK